MKALTMVAAIAGATLVVAGSGSASPRVGGSQTLTLVSVQKAFTTSPSISKTSPPTIGDRMIFADVLYNKSAQFGKPAGARVGTADNVCTMVSSTALQCSLVAHLPNGQVMVTGSVSENSHTTDFAITGGVGAYASASGQAVGRDLTDTKTLVTLQIAA